MIAKKYIHSAIILLALLVTTGSCKKFLEEEVYTEYDPTDFLKDQSGVDALLTGAYDRSRITGYDSRNYTFIMNEINTDIALEAGGGLERDAAPYIQFRWANNDPFLNGFWTKMYGAISSANTVLSVAKGLTGLPEENLKKIEAEARFIRASSYYYLYNLFGPTPIIEIPEGASPDEIEAIGKSTPRAARDVFVKYLEDDLTYAAENLPVNEDPIGRATKGSALAVLTKLYLHDKNWQKVVETTQSIIGLGYYSLYADYKTLFSVSGEANKEFIYRAPCIAQAGFANNYMAHAFPPNYPILANWANYGADFRTYTAFYKKFEGTDIRKDLIVTQFTNIAGNQVLLLEDANGKPLNDSRSFKYVPDPAAVGESNGNDIVYIRYADILLSRAEALNELSGPNDESITLINQVRSRAGAPLINLVDFTSTESLRDFLLDERAKEFYTEGLRREDLIRHGKFISGGQSRGYNARDFQVLFPIPQQQIDANNSLEQNPGY